MNYNLMKDDVRMVFKIPVKPIKKKKWWQFWKKDEPKAEESLQKLLAMYKDYWFPSPDWSNRKDKLEKIRTKINANYHSLYE
jgi:hypothetical protein